MRASYASSSGFPSDTSLLVDSCLAQVRKTARLDDDPVLPPLPAVTRRREVVMFTRSEVAGIAAGSAADASASERARAATQLVARPSSIRARSRATGSRWALLACTFIASTCASAAFLASPMGHKPAVVRVVDAAHARASHAVDAVHAVALTAVSIGR